MSRWSLGTACVAPAVSLLLVCGCASDQGRKPTTATNADANIGASVYRLASFKRSDMEMVGCSAALVSKLRSDRHFFIGRTDERLSVTGASSNSIDAAIWAIAAKSTGPQSSDVELRDKGAQTAELQQVWKAIEKCEKVQF